MFFSAGTITGFAQPAATPAERLKREQAIFKLYLTSSSIDSNITARLSLFIGPELDSARKAITEDTSLSDAERSRAISSMVGFIQELYKNISLGSFDVYDIPEALVSFTVMLKAFLYHEPYEHIVRPLNPRRTQLLASSFWQYDECELLEDIAVYKRLASSPEFILLNLEKYPGYRYADSLLLASALYNPMKIASYLWKYKTGLQDSIRNNKNIYIRQIVSLADDPNASELLPFFVLLAEKRISKELILEKRKEATAYFKLLVNTLLNERAGPGDPAFLNPLRHAIKLRAIAFYVNEINALHAAADNTRFASVKDLRMEDLYYIITSCGEELYTSSYLGLYKRLIQQFSTPSADSLFRLVGYDDFNPFIRMAANYNTLADFLSCMPPETARVMLNRFMSCIESNTHTGLGKAMDVADSFTGFGTVPGFSMLIRDELQSNLDRCRSGRLYFGERLYSILLKVFDLVKKKDPEDTLWSTLGNHEVLGQKELQDRKGRIIQLVLFYGDEDGIGSFNNFIGLFKDAGKWKIGKSRYWMTIRSLSGQPIIIYANLPLDNERGLDLQAQDSLSVFLQQQAEEPVIVMHRGHSYHLNQTLKKLQPSVRLAILGSCGGNDDLLSIANICPRAQIIVSKKIGSKFINDPMIQVINETLLHKKDLVWTEVWEKLRSRFGKDALALNIFNEYIPPSKNVSLFVQKLFNHYR